MFRTRRLGADLFRKDRFLWDESLLAVVLLALTSFHGFTMTPLWGNLNQGLRVETGLGSIVVFSLLMGICLIAPIVVFWTAASGVHRWNGRRAESVGKVFKAFAYSLIPVALFYHLAHNSMHFFLEAGTIIPALSDPLGRGWDLFGTAQLEFGPLLGLSSIWWLQIILIVIGHVYGVRIADRMISRIYRREGDRSRSLSVLLIVMIAFSCLSVWLISQPMDMKTAF